MKKGDQPIPTGLRPPEPLVHLALIARHRNVSEGLILTDVRNHLVCPDLDHGALDDVHGPITAVLGQNQHNTIQEIDPTKSTQLP